MRINRCVERLFAAPPFDLDKGERAAAPRDQVNLAAMDAAPLCKYPPPFEAQIPCGEGFGASALRLGAGAAADHRFPANSSAIE